MSMATRDLAAVVRPGTANATSPLAILANIAPAVVPMLYELADHAWPPVRDIVAKRFGVFGPPRRVRRKDPPGNRVVLRRFDLATIRPNWRLEAAGPVELFDWDDSGRVIGSYGFRYSVYTVYPVFDENREAIGFGINGRAPSTGDGTMSAIDARLNCESFVRSTDAKAVNAALRSVAGKPRTEESRPGMDPTDGYFDVLQHENKRSYLTTLGVNQYISPGWTSESVQDAFEDPSVRALWIGDPNRPSATPEPEAH